ncbi:MAG TPA: ammonium transporter [Mycobacteriales bacterium]|nr:ammonium transporter [Mycobacteriales bacterium]
MGINSGDTAWVLASSALVLLMTPGLAFFYGGMVRVKSVLNMLMMNFICLAIVGVLWVLYGYSLTFAPDAKGGLIGDLSNIGLKSTIDQVSTGYPDSAGNYPHAIPVLAFVMFQLMFAIITPALISGAIADRAKFWAWGLFVVLWATLVYFPVAHWVFAFDAVGPDGTTIVAHGGWIANKLGAYDFAGGTAVHINAGSAALALALVLGRRKGWPKERSRPHNVPFVLLGASLLWFGWFGFNAGSSLKADAIAANAFTTTMVATAAGVLGWLLVEQVRDGKPTTVGAASGAVAGLVAITPACAFVNGLGGIVVGIVAGVLCALAVGLKYRFGFDDSLDVVGVHLVGGLVGTLLVGFLATSTTGAGTRDGLLMGGGFDQLRRQAIAAGAVMAYSFVIAFVIGKLIAVTIGFRVSDEDEGAGVDTTEHAESGYELGAVTGVGSAYRPVPLSNEAVDA